MSATQEDRPLKVTDEELDISARSFWEQDYETRDKVFKRLREEMPISYHRPYESEILPPEEDTPGFWAVVKGEDLRKVSRDAETFCSGEGTLMEDLPEIARAATASFLMMDGEEHKTMRGIVQKAFTPRNVKKIEDWVDQHSKERIDEIIDQGQADFADEFSKYVPGRIFAHMMGIDRDSEDLHTIMEAAERMLAWDDPRMSQGRDALTTHVEESMRIQDVALKMADLRREDPQDDLVSSVVSAEIDGRTLDDWEVASFFSLLGSAANDTTRHSISHAVRLFSENPDQKEYLLEDLEGRVDNAVEEVLRFASPVMHFRRTATKDTTLGNAEIKKGDFVVMWYCSANRDEDIFPDAGTFDISRDVDNTFAFGGGGPHFCMGNALGRRMLRGALLEIYSRMPDIELAGEPDFQANNFIHGVHSLPVRWTPPQD